jgi:hypothetical protein
MDVPIDGREPPLARGGPAAVHSSLITVVTPVVGVQKFIRMANPVGVRWSCAVVPGQAAAFDLCSSSALADQAVVGTAGEEQVVGVGGPSIAPFRGVVNLTVIAGLHAVGVGAAAVAGVTV